MSYPTKLAQMLGEHDLSAAWLARKLGITRQAAAAWVRGAEAVPRARQAQIVLHLNEFDHPVIPTSWRSSELFDESGFARKTEEVSRA